MKNKNRKIEKKSWGNHLVGCQKEILVQDNTLQDSELVTKA